MTKVFKVQDKTGAASIAVSGATALFGTFSVQDWAAIAGIIGVVVTLAIKAWEARRKVKLQERESQAAIKAEEAKAMHYHRRSTDPEPESEDGD